MCAKSALCIYMFSHLSFNCDSHSLFVCVCVCVSLVQSVIPLFMCVCVTVLVSPFTLCVKTPQLTNAFYGILEKIRLRVRCISFSRYEANKEASEL